MKCPQCGSKVPNNSNFCPVCGHNFDVTVSSNHQDISHEAFYGGSFSQFESAPNQVTNLQTSQTQANALSQPKRLRTLVLTGAICGIIGGALAILFGNIDLGDVSIKFIFTTLFGFFGLFMVLLMCIGNQIRLFKQHSSDGFGDFVPLILSIVGLGLSLTGCVFAIQAFIAMLE